MHHGKELTQDKQQLLGSPQGEHGDEAAALPVNDVVHGVAEAGFPLLALLMDVRAVGGLLRDEHGHFMKLSITLTSHYRLGKPIYWANIR